MAEDDDAVDGRNAMGRLDGRLAGSVDSHTIPAVLLCTANYEMTPQVAPDDMHIGCMNVSTLS